MNRILTITCTVLVVSSVACSRTARLEFRPVFESRDKCESCETVTFAISAGKSDILFTSKQPNLFMGERSVVRAIVWPSEDGSWNVFLDLKEGAREKWSRFVAEIEGGQVVALLEDKPIAVLQGESLQLLILSGFANADDAEQLLATTRLMDKEVRVSEDQVEKALAKSSSENPELQSLLQRSDEFLRRAEAEDERWARMDSLLEREPRDLDDILDEAESMRRSDSSSP